MRQLRAFDSIGYLLESVLTGLEMNTRTREYLALILWPDIVGEQIARITAVRSVRNGVLYVDVESSAWAQELQLYRPDLVQKVNRYVGEHAIKDIHLRGRAQLPQRSSRLTPRVSARKSTLTPDIQLSLVECQEIADTARKIQDAELRETIASTMASYRRLEHWLQAQGWKRCPGCRALFQRSRCPFCKSEAPPEKRSRSRPAAVSSSATRTGTRRRAAPEQADSVSRGEE